MPVPIIKLVCTSKQDDNVLIRAEWAHTCFSLPDLTFFVVFTAEQLYPQLAHSFTKCASKFILLQLYTLD